MTEAEYFWAVVDGVVSFETRELSLDKSLEFLLEQADAPATTYTHKSMTATGLAFHVRLLRPRCTHVFDLSDDACCDICGVPKREVVDMDRYRKDWEDRLRG